jgi:uncharacterized Zn-binding protein involved in type VI secretion
MGLPIATADSAYKCFAFPDVVLTPAAPSPVPIPYPNIGSLGDATGASPDVTAGGKAVILKSSEIPSTSGDEAGTSGSHGGKVAFTAASTTVLVNGKGVVRMGDSTTQNDGVAVGTVLGGLTTVLVGG